MIPVTTLSKADAPGRLAVGKPIAIVDIGSNSVRLVAYEGLTRAPTPLFNDKVLCGLGRGVLTTGKLPQDGVERALVALRRFRLLCDIMGIGEVHCVATAAARDAVNGAEFLRAAEDALGARIELLSGSREAKLSALGVVSGFYDADGMIGDLGGGSLELNAVKGTHVGEGITLPLGGLALMDSSGRNVKRTVKIVRDALQECRAQLHGLRGRSFYAVGGTWRALARLHMHQRNYPLNVMHGYVMSAGDALDFCQLLERVNIDALFAIDSVAPARRPLLAYGAIVLSGILQTAKPRDITISALGVREGLLYERLTDVDRAKDPLIVAARELNILRSRAPQHGEDLCAWTDAFMRSTHLDESVDEKRLRHAACLLADIGWRAHPDYRGEQSLNIIANAAFAAIDHAGRAFLAIAISYRHAGADADVGPQIRTLASARMLDRAHIVGAAMRVGYVLSAAMPDVLPRCAMTCVQGRVMLHVPRELADLVTERVANRLKQLARLIGRESGVEILV